MGFESDSAGGKQRRHYVRWVRGEDRYVVRDRWFAVVCSCNVVIHAFKFISLFEIRKMGRRKYIKIILFRNSFSPNSPRPPRNLTISTKPFRCFSITSNSLQYHSILTNMATAHIASFPTCSSSPFWLHNFSLSS